MIQKSIEVQEYDPAIGATQTKRVSTLDFLSMMDDHVHMDNEFDLAGQKSVKVLTVPKGAKLKKLAVQVTEPIQGNGIKNVGFGTEKAPHSLGKSKGVDKNEQFVHTKEHEVSEDTDYYVFGLGEGGKASDSNITSGKVRVVACYEPEFRLPDVS